ncbi:MAG: 16S rRNA (uracil(1498)-N(3))-methyltransferase [Sphingobacteriales bacterium]|nr:MAG: 16S rRNA (uracil(1498)-N(3))-methyltransferase [Sphingobacteriales bacterium]
MLPFFYHPALDEPQKTITLDEPTSKHCIQVLRMQEGEMMMLTDGKGRKVLATIVAADRKRCGVRADRTDAIPARPYRFSLGIAFTKNNSRNEWLLEKATEMGVEDIYPLICSRSEKEKFNPERLKGILVSAMLQSQQAWLPVLSEPVKYKDFIKSFESDNKTQLLIAHCETEGGKVQLRKQLETAPLSSVILIGPEGDFSAAEIALAASHHFLPVALGDTRLRTETAGIVAATLMCNR